MDHRQEVTAESSPVAGRKGHQLAPGLELFAQLASLLLLLLLSHFAGFALHDGFACLFGEVELGAHSEVPDELVPPALAAVLSGPSQTLCFGQFTQPQLVFRIAAGAGGPLL